MYKEIVSKSNRLIIKGCGGIGKSYFIKCLEEEFEYKANELEMDKKLIREQTRTHNDLNVKFDMLSKTEQNKDVDPMNDMMKLIEKYDGLRVYQF